MHFTISQDEFSNALSLISTVVPERSARAVLQNLMLTGNDDSTITLSATDLEIGLTITLTVRDMQEPSSILLPASRLNALIKGAFSDDVTLDIHETKAEITTPQGHFHIPGQETLDYPTIPAFKNDGAVFIHGDDFADAVQKTVFATAKGDTRYALNGIYVNITDGHAEFVASDTFRLSLVKKKIRNPDTVTADAIVLTKGMTTLSRLAAGHDVVELAITEKELLARTENATIIIRRVEGMFPRYSDVIPAASETSFTVNRETLLRSLHSIGLLSSGESKSVLFSIADGVVQVSAASENGDGVLRLDATTSGQSAEIKFNFTLLIDALKNIAEETATIQYRDSDSPARIDSGDFLYIIMPINK